MKGLLVAALLLAASAAHAVPYFRFVDIGHPNPILGAAIDPKAVKQSRAIGLYPIFTHSPKDGCLLPGIVCEDWTPLALGGSLNSGKLTFDVAPMANLLPWMQSGIAALAPASWESVHYMVDSAPGEQPVTIAVGPLWEYRQLENKGYFMVVTAFALHF